MLGIQSFTFRKAVLAATLLCPLAHGLSVSSTILVFARDTSSAYSVTSGLQGHGIPYQTVIVPSSGVTLPVLNSSLETGNYGGFVVLSEVSYDYNGSWASAISPEQWQQIYSYQTDYGVRLVRLDAYPGSDFGATTAIAGAGCCDTGVEQLVSITNSSSFATAGLVE